MTRTRLTITIALAALVLSGCGFTGMKNTPLPFTEGSGEGAITVVVEMANAVNLVPNSEVKVNDVTVGTVRKIEFENWHARLTLGLNPGTRLPENAEARIGQKSLLGAEYLELSAPANARGTLTDESVIPLRRTGRYPETEEVLAAASMMLNGGGLEKIRTITHEMNNVLGGREADVRALIGNLNSFVGGLNSQRRELLRMIDGLDRLSGTLARQRDTVARALDHIPDGLRTLNEEREELVRTMEALSDFGDAADPVLTDSRDKLVANLHHLRPALRELADAGKHLPQSLGHLTLPFPIDATPKAFKGDYLNFFIVVDLTLPTLDRNFLSGTPLEGMLVGPLGGQAEGPGTQQSDPFRAPLTPPRDALPKSVPLPDGSAPLPSEPTKPTTTPSEGPLGLLDPLVGGGR